MTPDRRTTPEGCRESITDFAIIMAIVAAIFIIVRVGLAL